MPPIEILRSCHHLEQRGLHLGRRAVDLVGQQEVHHDRAEFDVELFLALAVDAGTDDVGGHQVGRELDAGERAADHLGERLHRQRLGHAGNALEQHVALGEQADEHPLDQQVLADDDPLDLEDRAFQGVHLGLQVHGLEGGGGPGRACSGRITLAPGWRPTC